MTEQTATIDVVTYTTPFNLYTSIYLKSKYSTFAPMTVISSGALLNYTSCLFLKSLIAVRFHVQACINTTLFTLFPFLLQCRSRMDMFFDAKQ